MKRRLFVGWGNPDLISEIIRKHNQLTQEVENALNLHVDAHNALIDKTQQRTDMLADWLREHDESHLAHSDRFLTVSKALTDLQNQVSDLRSSMRGSVNALHARMDRAKFDQGDPGNYLHRLNQTEADIRELRQIVETNRQMCDGNVSAALDFMEGRINTLGTHNDSGTDSGADRKPDQSPDGASGLTGSAREH